MILVYPLDLIAPVNDQEIEQIRASAGDVPVVVTRDLVEAKKLSEEAQVIFGDIHQDFFLNPTQLQWVQSVGAGVNKIADYIGDRPIKLVSARGLVGSHLAEHAFALLLAITRGVAEAIRAPGWENRERIRIKQWEFTDKTIAIVGMGSAGQALAKRARGFEFKKIIGIDIDKNVQSEFLDQVITPDLIANILPDCDVICLTLPLTQVNKGWFDYELMSKLKQDAILINVARGGLVVEADLLQLLSEKRLFAAGLDVLESEPLLADNNLYKRSDLVITPHIAGGSPLRAKRVIDQFCSNLELWRSDKTLKGLYDSKMGF
jgi:phosphoglycerate dehydrogenase-like enzyme